MAGQRSANCHHKGGKTCKSLTLNHKRRKMTSSSKKKTTHKELTRPRVIHSVKGDIRTLRPFICDESLFINCHFFVHPPTHPPTHLHQCEHLPVDCHSSAMKKSNCLQTLPQYPFHVTFVPLLTRSRHPPPPFFSISQLQAEVASQEEEHGTHASGLLQHSSNVTV